MTNDVLLRDPPVTPRREVRSLDVFLAPASVAIFGADEEPNSAGRMLLSNLIRNPFGGVLFPISSRRSVLGIETYPSLAAVPEQIDLAVVLSPAPEVPDVLDECSTAGVKALLILSPDPDLCIQRHLCQRPAEPMRVLGPGSHGIARPRTGFTSTLIPARIRPGNLALLSQDGDLLTAFLSREHSELVGCSAFISVGGGVDVSWSEWIDYLARDAQTECIGVYVETLKDPRAFFDAVRGVAARKPILLVKSGDIISARCGSPKDDVFDEACRSSGILRVRRMADLFRMAHLLTTQPPARGRRLAILTNAHGPGALAAD